MFPLVGDLKNAAPDAKADNVQQSVSMSKPAKLYADSNLKSKVVRDLDPGMMLYPTGDKMGNHTHSVRRWSGVRAPA
jgi:hypothetical protein